MRLILCGDVVPTDATRAAFESGDARALFGAMTDEFARADAAIINLECALTDSDTPIRKCGPNLKGAPKCARALTAAGITHAGLSNNHVCDFGVIGLCDTERVLESVGIAHFGSGKNDIDSRRAAFIERNGERIGLYAVCEHEYSYALPNLPGANPFDPFLTVSDVRRIKQDCDKLIVMYHGGKEQCQYPSPRLRGACRALAEAGADIVLTQHSHCVGCRERYMGAEIVYGQGNFCFVANQEHPHWRSGLALSVDTADPNGISYIPIVTSSAGVDIADDAHAREIMDGFDERSRLLMNDAEWIGKWREFCESVRPQYTAAARDAFSGAEAQPVRQIFPHYLDCEAHLDVWKTLFETWHITENK